jgi:cell division protein FtsA
MLVAIHNATLEKYRAISSGANLTPAFFEIEVFSAVRASLDHGIAPVAVVDFGAATTKFYVVERGIVRESHLINRGSQELTLSAARALNITVAQAEERKRRTGLIGGADASTALTAASAAAPDLARQSFELTLAPLLADIAHTIASFEQHMSEAISTIVFTGGGASLRGFAQYAQSKLQAEVRLSDPFGKTETPAFLTSLLRETGPEFSVAVGAALRRLQETW